MKNKLSKRDFSILIANSLDHFDTAIYGFLAPIMAKIFFPDYDPMVGLILTYSVFASSLITRPIGAVIFSLIAKKRGAILSLSYSLIGLSLTTISIGLIPTHEMIGYFAPVILTITRVMQGIFAEGEKAIAKLYIIENKLHIQAVKASSLYQFSIMVGIILASFVSTLLIAYGDTNYWRLCFILGGVIGIIGYNLRKNSNDKNSDFKPERLTFFHELKLINKNKFKILSMSMASWFSYVTYSVPFIVMNNFIPEVTAISLNTMMNHNTVLLVLDAAMLLLAGLIIKKYAANKILIISALTLCISIVPIWANIPGSNLIYISFVRIWIITIGVFFACAINLWINDLLKDSNKYLLSSLSDAIGSAIGRTTPAICIALWHFTKFSLSIAIYIAVISLMTVLFIKLSFKTHHEITYNTVKTYNS